LNPITLSLIPGPSRASTDLLDFHETFIPVAIHAFIGMLRVLAHHHKWNIHQLDVSNDFLHAMLTQPPGYDVPSKAHYVYKLQISLFMGSNKHIKAMLVLLFFAVSPSSAIQNEHNRFFYI